MRWRLPFSHRPGTKSFVPWSDWIVEVFDLSIRVGERSFPLSLTGPIEEFTVQLDLPKGCVWVWGKAKEGYYRFRLQAEAKELVCVVDRAPGGTLSIGSLVCQAKEKVILLKGGATKVPRSCERLSLGSWKYQNIDRIRENREDELLAPLLFWAGQMVPVVKEIPFSSDFLWEGLLVPEGANPFPLLAGAYEQIRHSLVQETSGSIQCLPSLSTQWRSGTALLHLEAGTLQMNWRKGKIRSALWTPNQTGEWAFSFPQVTSFRQAGRRFQNGARLDGEIGSKIFIDQFL